MKERIMMSWKPSFPALPFMLTALLLALTGCGSLTPTQPPAGNVPAVTMVDACSLLTKADAEGVLGKPVDQPTHPVQSSESVLVDSCDYQITGGTARDHAILTIVVPASGDLESAKKSLQPASKGPKLRMTPPCRRCPGWGIRPTGSAARATP